MKKIVSFTFVLILIGVAPVFAIPTLQLDIADGVYDPVTETIVATSTSFTLYALLTPQANDDLSALLGTTYYLSAAIIPVPDDGADIGSFTIYQGPAGIDETVHVTSDMVYGTPPVEAFQEFDSGDLSKHGVFPTYFSEFSFIFDESAMTATYNAQDDPGGFTGSGTGTYYAAFEINTAGLMEDYVVHFDLYDEIFKAGDIDAGIFAPFSHDAQSTPVPEPATILLLGTGLLGVAGITRRRLKS